MTHRGTQRIGRRALLTGAAATAGGLVTARTAQAAPARPHGAGRPQGMGGPTSTDDLTFRMLLTPVRAYDSRLGQAPDGTDTVHSDTDDTAFALNETRTIDISNILGTATPTNVPQIASAVLLNVTALNTTGARGFLKVWSDGVAEPAISALNWYSTGAIVANSVTTLCSNGYIKVKCGGVTGSTCNVIVDVLGYYMAPIIIM